MLPQELHREVGERENFTTGSLDKQNVIPAFQWTGESLYDLAGKNARLFCRWTKSEPRIIWARYQRRDYSQRSGPYVFPDISFALSIEFSSIIAIATLMPSPNTRSGGNLRVGSGGIPA